MKKRRKVPMRQEDAEAIADTFMASRFGQDPMFGQEPCLWKRVDASLTYDRLWQVMYIPVFINRPGGVMDGGEMIVVIDPYSRKAMFWHEHFAMMMRADGMRADAIEDGQQ